MKVKFLFVLIVLTVLSTLAQDKELIYENDSLSIFDSFISINSSDNLFPKKYKNGVIYSSKYKSEYYDLYYSNLESAPIKLKIGSKYNYGGAAIFNNEIYFSGNDRLMHMNNNTNHLIYKALINDLKVTKYRVLNFCKRNFSYEYPAISEDGLRMVVVTNERGRNHLLELIRNENNVWERNKVVFISQSKAEFLNPTYYDENTIYFSSNMIAEEDRFGLKFMNGSWVKVKTKLEESIFDIYKVTRINGTWSLPVKVPKFNSEFDDLGVEFIDENSGYISTYRFSNTDNFYYFKLK
jgi:hypothetical protein